ncbi:MAG: Maf family protein [Lachnospiraceae bacterium]|nr:Maf family protein [Lachnospiraceae bacterium]
MKIYLASASPRRRELLERLGISFAVVPAQGEEHITEDCPQDVVVELARQKAGEIYEKLMDAKTDEEDVLVIGADTVVCCDGVILGKPGSTKDAEGMLRRLSGRTHQVYTGVALWMRERGETVRHSFYEKTDVTMYELPESDIAAYVASGEPMDKAGSYGIQGTGAVFVRSIAGDYNNVVGLPVARLYQELKQLGIETGVWHR